MGSKARTVTINPLNVLLWTFRRRESDIVNLYDSLSLLMKISTGSHMLNFGYWTGQTQTPYEAQTALCKKVGKLAEFETARRVLDVGSGYSEPSAIWRGDHPHLMVSCLNVNRRQLAEAAGLFCKPGKEGGNGSLGLLNSTATKLPFADGAMDRVVALESAQHFRPISEFISESRRVLHKGGILVMAMPVMRNPQRTHSIFKLGILSLTWTSEHYALEDLVRIVKESGMKVVSVELTGSKTYEPLAEFYIRNREKLRSKILERYPAYVESILFRSLLRMKSASEKSTIDYLILKSVVE